MRFILLSNRIRFSAKKNFKTAKTIVTVNDFHYRCIFRKPRGVSIVLCFLFSHRQKGWNFISNNTHRGL